MKTYQALAIVPIIPNDDHVVLRIQTEEEGRIGLHMRRGLWGAPSVIVGAAAGVVAIYDYFEAERVLGARQRGSAATFRRREAPKVGRNELCPCGSGKKFKHCCAKATLH